MSVKIAGSLGVAMLVALVGPSLNLATLPAALPMLSQFFGGGSAGDLVAQSAMALAFLGLAIGGLVAGKTIDLLGLTNCLRFSAAFFALAGLGCAAAVEPTLLLVCCFIIGLSGAVLASSLVMVTGLLLEGTERVRMLGFQAAASDVGSILGALTAAGLAQFYGWRAPFVIFVAFGVVIFLLVVRAQIPTAARTHPGLGLMSVARMAPGSYLAGGCIFFLTASVGGVLPFHLVANGLGTPGLRSIVLTSVPIFATTASTLYAFNRGRIGDQALIAVAIVAAAVGFAGFALWRGGLAPAAMSAGAMGTAVGIAAPMSIRTMLRKVPSDLHGYSMGLMTTAFFFGGFISPLVLGRAYQNYGASAVFAACAAASVIGGVAAIVRLRRVRVTTGADAAAPVPNGQAAASAPRAASQQ